MLTNVSGQQEFDTKEPESVPISLDIHDNYFPDSNTLSSEPPQGNTTTMTNNNNANVRQRRSQTSNSKNNNCNNNNKSITTDEDDNDSDSNMDGILHSSEKPLLNKKSNRNTNNKNKKNKNKNNKNNNNNNNNNSNNDSSSSNDKPNTSNGNSNNSNNGTNVEISGKKESKIKKFCTRFLTTWSMIALFGFLLYLGHFFVAALLVALQAQAFREISDLGAIERIQLQLSGYKLLHWHLFLTSLFFLYGQTLLEMSIMTKQAYFVHASRFLLRHHGLITFSMVCLGLISFVLSLKKGFYKYQFKQLAWCLVIIIVVVGQSAFAIRNLFEGMIWLVIPALCIITNDIMAYMCGMSFGRTPLIKLSPNKTWEGAIGGGFFTIIIAFIFSPLAINYQMMICPKRDWTFDWPQCDKDYTFLQQPYSFPENLQNIGETIGISSYWMNDWMVAPFQFHALMFAAFASIVGPFGGFFASGFKRAFGIKDFANIIPGHGGITDRMDCQILMCAFVYVYRKSFVQTLSMTVNQLLPIIMQMSNEDQRALMQGIQAAMDDNNANNMS